MRCLILSLFILILSGCSAEWHLRQAVRKDPSITKSQIVNVTDTVVTERIVVKDSVVTSPRDTIVLTKDKFRVRIIRSYDTLKIDGGCESDTIVRTIRVDVPQLVVGETRFQRIQRFTFWGLITLLLIAICLTIIKKSIWLK
jgi:hypothetical protein